MMSTQSRVGFAQLNPLAVAMGAIMASSVSAQEPQAAQPATAPLEEIIVTAQKRAQDIRTVPIAMAVLTDKNLRDQNIRQFNEVPRTLVGVSMTKTGETQVQFQVRGVTNTNFTQNTSQPVALYVDEGYKGLPVFNTGQMFDLERIEILKGPQGTLFGRNATGGAVSMVTNRPDLNGADDTGYLMLGIGEYNRREYEGAMDLSLIPGELAVRVAASGTITDGVLENLIPGNPDHYDLNQHGFRANMLWQPSDRLSVLGRYNYTYVDQAGFSFRLENIGIGGPGGIGYSTGVTDDPGFWRTREPSVGQTRTETQSFGLNIDYELTDSISLTSITTYDFGEFFMREDVDSLPDFLFNADFSADNAKQFSQDLRLASTGDGPFQWLVGAYAYAEEGDFVQIFDIFGAGLNSTWGQEVTSFALYSHNTYDLTDKLQLIAGLRYTDEEVELTEYFARVDPVTNPLGVIREEGPFIFTFDDVTLRKVDAQSTDWKLGLSYDIDGNTFVFGHVATGFRAPIFGGGTLDLPSVSAASEEELISYEIGLRTTLFDITSVNLSTFYYDYEGLQFFAAEGLLFPLRNADGAEQYGAELETVSRFTDNFTFKAGVSYLSAEYEDTILGEGTATELDISGNQLVYVPEWTAAIGIDWTIFENEHGRLTLSANSKYLSDQFTDVANTDLIKIDSYWWHDARATYSFADDRRSLSFWITNIGDEEICNQRANLIAVLNATGCLRDRPRELGVQFTQRF